MALVLASWALMAWLAVYVEGGWKYAVALLVLPWISRIPDLFETRKPDKTDG